MTAESEGNWFAAYGLQRDPFPESDNPSEFFSRAGRDRHVKLLSQPSSLRRSLIVVEGEAGAGKTMLFYQVLAALPDHMLLARVSAGVFLSAANLLRAICKAMRVPAEEHEDADTLRARLHAALKKMMAEGSDCAVLVDDASDLEGDALSELVEIAELVEDGNRVHTYLFALPGIREPLARAASPDRVASVIQEIVLDRYSLNELRGYLQFRLAAAGLQGPSPFTEDDYQDVFRRCGGLPGKANAIAAHKLRNPPRGPVDRWKWIGGGVLAAVSLALVVILLMDQGADVTPPSSGVATESDAAPSPVQEAVGDTVPHIALEPPRLTEAEAIIAGRWREGDPGPSQPVSEPAEPSSDTTARETVRAADPVIDDSVRRTIGGTAVVVADGAGVPAPGAGEAAISAMNPQFYTLQVMVNSSYARAREWVEGRTDPSLYHVYRRERDSAAEYVIVHGTYATQAAASRQADRIAGETGQAPWIRSVASVQEEIAVTP